MPYGFPLGCATKQARKNGVRHRSCIRARTVPDPFLAGAQEWCLTRFLQCGRTVPDPYLARMRALQAVEGVAESALGDADAARLPSRSAPAPWDTVLDAV